MRLYLLLVLLLVVACRRADENQPSNTGPGPGSSAKPATSEQVPPPVDLKSPPGDATKTASGLIYKKLATSAEGDAVKRNDTVLVHVTGWEQATGATFYTTRSLKGPQRMNLATSAPGFVEGLQSLKKGEKVILWLPPELAYKDKPPAGAGTRIYEIEITDIVPAPETPALQPPANAETTKAGGKLVVVKPGTGKDKARYFDTVTFHYTAWDSAGRMFASTELKKQPTVAPPYKQAVALEQVLTTMTQGQRDRLWIDAKAMKAGHPTSAMLPEGMLTYDVELVSIDKGAEPPAAPPDVGGIPGGVAKTPKGVAYRVLTSGKGGPKPKVADSVRVNYTGWTTDGRLIESSVIRGAAAQLSVSGGMEAWTEALPLMSVGDKYRFWFPESLAHKGTPNQPQGTLVYEVELLEIIEPGKVAQDDDGHGHGRKPPQIPAPPDVAKPPANAKKTAKGVFYKVITAGKGGPKPTTEDSVRVHYTGWQTDGKMFDSSVAKGQPAEFRLTGVIKGWTDGLQVMSVGDKVRFWIPEELAYKDSPGRPQGMLVFDVELLEINPKPPEGPPGGHGHGDGHGH